MPWFRSSGRSRSRARFTHKNSVACPGFDRVAYNDDASLIDNNNNSNSSRQPQLPLSILIGTSSGARLLPTHWNAKKFLRGRSILPFYSTIKASPFGLRGTLWADRSPEVAAPQTPTEIKLEISVGGRSRTKDAKPAPQEKKNSRGNAPKNDENWLKIRNFDRFYGFTSKTYGKSRSVGCFLPHDRPR
jgi:hypothetical protein